ncbi:TfoX/Sxy family protein [Ancylobacter radicis]|uniref:TfoX/Sxy family protein n=1 Tax=Ancylobacter radicis TaxID=2836179 RepID=A0ABS5R880_9HYPH|nr:TfoX/Sxy family protein [Ancylobacter radicis]MBS9477878.1 TfoX/Sxy family protein [Ancylobacter radicis]
MDEASLADLFIAFGEIRCRRMFGGLGVYAEGVMFALVAQGRLYLKADKAFADELSSRGCEPFAYEARGRRVSLGYWSMPEAAFDDPEEAAALARQALVLAHRAKAEAPRRRAPIPRTT